MKIDQMIYRLAHLQIQHGNLEVRERENGDPAEPWFDPDAHDGCVYVG